VDTSSEKYYNIDNYFYEGATLSQRQQRQEIILEPFRRRKRRQTASDRSYRGKERATQNLVDFTNVIASHENVQNSRHNAPTAVVMHPLLPHIASSGGKGLIRVFDYASKTITNAFDAQLPTRSATQISLVNQLDDAMLLCAGSDGSVKLWRDYFRRGEETLVAAWRTLKSRPRAYKTHGTYNAEDTADWRHHHSSHHPKNSKTNAVVLWQQAAGCLYSAGNTLPNPILNVWDASRELCLESLVTPSAATSLAAEGALLMVGANDGSVLSYDLRTPARLLSAIKKHGDSVVSILLQPGSVGNLVATGSSSGDVHFCDLRNAAKPFFMVNVSGKPVARQDYDEGTTLDGNAIDSVVGGVSGAAKTNQPSPLGGGGGRHSSQLPAKKRLLTTLISTPVAPCIVGGTTKDAIKIWDVEGNEIGEVLYTNKTTKARLGAISAMAFHPNQMCFTAGDIRGATTVFGMSEDVL
jgi:regulator-associated protein of mTOR